MAEAECRSRAHNQCRCREARKSPGRSRNREIRGSRTTTCRSSKSVAFEHGYCGGRITPDLSDAVPSKYWLEMRQTSSRKRRQFSGEFELLFGRLAKFNSFSRIR